jgi:hypothetical protein
MSLRTFIAALVLGLLLLGCSAASRLQSYSGNKYRYFVSMVAPEKSAISLFRDEALIIQFRFDDPAIRFQLQNISDGEMEIDWARASLGIRAMYSPVRNLSSLYDSGAATATGPVIPSLGVARDIILPRKNVSFDGTQWKVADLLPTTDRNSPQLRDSILASAGTEIDVMLPVWFGGNPRLYHFRFAVDSVSRIPWSEDRVPAWLPPVPPARKLRPSTVEQITAAIIAGSFLGVFAYMRTAKKTPIAE